MMIQICKALIKKYFQKDNFSHYQLKEIKQMIKKMIFYSMSKPQN